MKYIEHYCPVCGNVVGGFSEKEEVQISEKKCIYCGSEIINSEKEVREFMSYVNEQHVSLEEAVRRIYVYDNPLYDKHKEAYRLQCEKAHQDKMDRLHQKYDRINVPKCPTCGSTQIRSISGLERGASVLGLGLFSKKINKSFQCNHCGYTW